MKNHSSPAGGYIVVDHLYAKVLRKFYPSTYHAIPKTLYHRHADDDSQKQHTVSDDNQMNNEVPFRRRKRNGHHTTTDERKDKKVINFEYCCMHKCKPYDLCEL